MAFEDRTLLCRDCGKQFTWKASDQDFFAQKGYSAPGRCKDCRYKRKAQAEGFQGASHRREYDITCSKCKNTGKVPFEPSTKQSLLCTGCFINQRATKPIGTKMPTVVDNAIEPDKKA